MKIRKARLVVLISGSGSNLQALIDACADGSLKAEIVAVVSNKADAFGLQRAATAKIPQQVVDHRKFISRESFDAMLAEVVDSYRPDLVILAGFMRILTPGFVDRFAGRMLNIHPSLLPKYPGLNTHQRAIDAGESEAGATVHFVTNQLDGGPAVLKASVPILEVDTAETLAARVLVYEHKIFPLAAQWFCENRLHVRENVAWLDNTPIPEGGIFYNKLSEPSISVEL